MDRIEKLKELLAQQPGDSFLRHAMALELIKLGHDDQAAVQFEQLLSSDPGYVGSYYHLAKLYERSGDDGKAEAFYERGMAAAQAAGDQHSYNELRGAYEELTM